jgi:P-type Cu2+ transporter
VSTPALVLPDSAAHDAWQFLDQPEHLADYTETEHASKDARVTAAFIVEGMHCAACARAIETRLATLAGLLSCAVSYAGQRVRVTYLPQQLAPSQIARAIAQAGYRALPVRSIQAENARAHEHHMALWRLLVAGFCMMQIMMYTTPLYLAAPGEIPEDLQILLRWASWVLCLPVLLFSAAPFFRAAWADLRARRVGMDTPVAVGIVLAFAAGSMATFMPNGPLAGESYLDAISMLVFFLLAGRFLEQKARNNTIGLIDAIVQRIPEAVDRFDPINQTYTPVSVKQLHVGDLVRIRAGQAFAGDGVVHDGTVYTNEALLTGESRAVKRVAGEAVLAGAVNVGGPALVRINALAKSTRFAQIVQLVEHVAAQKPRWADLADRVAGPFLLAVMLLAALAAGAWWWLAPELAPHMPIKVALAVLIVTCPCALALATPSAMLAAAGHLASRGILVRRMRAIELLSQVRTFEFDKTGTLTEDQLALAEVQVFAGVARAHALELAAALAQDSLHPIARAIVQAAHVEGVAARRHMHDVREHAGAGMSATGAQGHTYRLGSARWCGVGALEQTHNDSPHCYLAQDGQVIARFVLAERLRPGAKASVQALQAQSLRVGIVSGDRQSAAQSLGQSIHADFAVGDAAPEQKLALLLTTQREHGVVAVVGDGVNDAPILAQADVSFTLGQATPLAQQTADFIVLSNHMADVTYTHALARRAMRIVRQNLAWAAAYNLICVPLAAAGMLPPWLAALGMAGSSLFVVTNALRLVRRTEPANEAVSA